MSSGERGAVAFYGVRDKDGAEPQRLATWRVEDDGREIIEFGDFGRAIHENGELIFEVEGAHPQLRGETNLRATFTRGFVEHEDGGGRMVTETPILTDGRLRGMLLVVSFIPTNRVQMWQLVIDGIEEMTSKAYIPSE